MSRRPLLAAVAAIAAVMLVAAEGAQPRRGVWFAGDFETGNLQGWGWDLARAESAQVVQKPVRRGRYAVRITLAPGDRAASKERAELKLDDKSIERVHGRPGGEMWYGWSFLIPADYVDPADNPWQIVGQWHQRPPEPKKPGERPGMEKGAPPLLVYLESANGRHALTLIGRPAPKAPPRTLGSQPIQRGKWVDLIFHIKWSTGKDGFVEAWLDGKPFTSGKMYGPTLYSPITTYLRLGLYRPKGVEATTSVYYDEVRLGDSYQAVAP